MNPRRIEALRPIFEGLYAHYNDPRFIAPDPLQCVTPFRALRDREIAGLVAASLAFGSVKPIVRSVEVVLKGMESPHAYVTGETPRAMRRRFRDFRHRYVGGEEIAGLLRGIRGVLREYGTLRACFQAGLDPQHDTVWPALGAFVEALQAHGAGDTNYLLPDPRRGSACKRLHLYLRWMVRRDAVDPGGWEGVSPALLVVPLDTHLHRVARLIGLTQRNAADARTATEVTRALRNVHSTDPVRYDFGLTRLGIRKETNYAEFVGACKRSLHKAA